MTKRGGTVIVNFRTGNLFSVYAAVREASVSGTVTITDVPELVAAADRIILPGQGNADCCLGMLKYNANLWELLSEVLKLKPVLGICVGEQLLCLRTEESFRSGLGYFLTSAKCLRSPNRIPNIDWKAVWFDRPHPIWFGIPMTADFWFSHSYYVNTSSQYSIGTSFCGKDIAASMIVSDNVIATQFHPEKSAHFGAVVLRNFLRWKP